MRQVGLRGVVRGRRTRTTILDEALEKPLDRVQRRFVASRPGMDSATARHRSSVAMETPSSCDTVAIGALSGGSNRATVRSLDSCPYRAP
jgi:hypothetical protein